MATQVPIPVMRVSGAFAFIVFLYVVVVFGSLHLLAISKPDWTISKVILGLGF